MAVLVLANGLTTQVIAMNDEVLKQVVLLAAFIPLLIGAGGNVGAQSSTVVIRGLSTQRIQRLGLFKAIAREALAGALLGILMAIFVVPFAWWQGEGPLVATAVGISLMAITTLAATAGAALPLLFDRMGLAERTSFSRSLCFSTLSLLLPPQKSGVSTSIATPGFNDLIASIVVCIAAVVVATTIAT